LSPDANISRHIFFGLPCPFLLLTSRSLHVAALLHIFTPPETIVSPGGPHRRAKVFQK
jgi:hypothetical protein